MPREVKLNDLEREHPLRNQPLLGAQYCTRGKKTRKNIEQHWKLAKVTFNDLAEFWYEKDDWFVQLPEEDIPEAATSG